VIREILLIAMNVFCIGGLTWLLLVHKRNARRHND